MHNAPSPHDDTRLYIGLMSGTSMDGVDAVLLRAQWEDGQWRYTALDAHHLPMPSVLRQTCLALNRSGGRDELHQAACAANALSQWYARAVQSLLAQTGLSSAEITAVGAHGQTVRHQPSAVGGAVADCEHAWTAYTLQLLNPALLVELTNITVVADFRSRDVAAGGQGAPLVPAFHRAMFAPPPSSGRAVAVLNIGGMANVSLLLADGTAAGFDTGPGNVLLDAWCERHTGRSYDADGAWAASGTPHMALLDHWLADPYFQRHGPRSTGREYFHMDWIEQGCHAVAQPLAAADVQATLMALTARTIAHALHGIAPQQVIVCGGGVFNAALMQALRDATAPATVRTSDDCGLPAMQVEAAAFAWLAHQTLTGRSGNVMGATGATGARVLGAIYPK